MLETFRNSRRLLRNFRPTKTRVFLTPVETPDPLLSPEHAAADSGRTDPLHVNRQSGIVMADITAYAHLLSYQGAGGAGRIVIFRGCGCAASQQHGGTECRTGQCFHVPILGV